MNITPRIKSARNRTNLIVNVSIEIPLKGKVPVSHRSQETSLSPSPHRLRKRFKLISSAYADKKTLHTSNVLTVREGAVSGDPAPSRKKPSNPTPSTTAHPSCKGTLGRFRSSELSPRQRAGAKKGKAKIRNISILEQVMGEDDIIKYTSNSNQLRDKAEDLLLLENLGRKIDTHVSEIDLAEVRRMESSARDSRERVCLRRVQDLLRTACAKKIQRAWRNYKTKKLIRSYSNDIRNKYLRSMHISDDPATTRSQGTGLRFKKKLMSYDEIVGATDRPQQEQERRLGGVEVEPEKQGRSSRMVKKIQEDNMEKWEGLIEQIKNKKNITAALQFSIQRSKELKQELGKEFFKAEPEVLPSPSLSPSPPPASPPPSPPSQERKIIKTKKYYEGEREKWRQSMERSTGSIQREQRVNYFENEMLRLENDYSDSADSSLSHSLDLEGSKQQEEIENFKLRKKLEVFRNHLPEVPPFHPQQNSQPQAVHTHSNRIDIATIIRKKSESSQERPQGPQGAQGVPPALGRSKSIEVIEFDLQEDAIDKSPSSSSSQSLIDTHREWRPVLQLEERGEEGGWRERLGAAMRQQEGEVNQLVLEELVLEALIEVSESERLIAFIKAIHDRSKGAAGKKEEGIVTNHSSIRDYISYFINYLYEYKVDAQILKNLQRPLGPSPRDVLRYFRGEEIAYDPESEYVMGIRVFNAHWEYANELIYFDRKWEDEAREAERVGYLKQLTKVFFRAIFDCFNESLEGLRIYGQRGRPYPWSQQRLRVDPPELKRSLTLAFQRVLRYSLVFAGVLFQDKQHSLDERSMEEIQEANTVKLITLELQDDEPLWLFLEDELAEIKLELAQHVEQALLAEVARIVAVRSSSR